MRPEIMRPVPAHRFEQVQILELSERKQRRRDDNIHAQHILQSMVLEIEGVRFVQQTISIRKHCPGILNHVDVSWGPSCSDVSDDCLLEQRPVACEADE